MSSGNAIFFLILGIIYRNFFGGAIFAKLPSRISTSVALLRAEVASAHFFSARAVLVSLSCAAACGNNFQIFRQSSPALSAEERDKLFSPSSHLLYLLCVLFYSSSLFTSLSRSPQAENSVGRSAGSCALCPNLFSQQFLLSAILRFAVTAKQIFSFIPLRQKFTYTKENARSCRQSHNFP